MLGCSRDGPPPQAALTVARILAWADSHLARTGRWPGCEGGHVLDDRNEEWENINQALARGYRGLPGGDTLARPLTRERGRRHANRLPQLTEEQVAEWARTHRARTGRWPREKGGPVKSVPGETWSAIGSARRQGLRGLPRTSLPRLLARRFGDRNRGDLLRLTEQAILRWPDAYHEAHGRWPICTSGAIAEAPGETWAAVQAALPEGGRGLPGGSSLGRLLAERRQVPNRVRPPRLPGTYFSTFEGQHFGEGDRFQLDNQTVNGKVTATTSIGPPMVLCFPSLCSWSIPAWTASRASRPTSQRDVTD
jgi:hypothetical protein